MMQLIQKLSTVMRGGTRDVLDSAVDANALSILCQEIHACEVHMQQSKQQLANVVTEKLGLKRKLDAQTACIKSKQEEIRKKPAQGCETQATRLAEDLAAEESLLKNWQAKYEQLLTYEEGLLQSLKSTAYTLSEYRTELRTAKATQQTQMSVSPISTHHNIHKHRFTRVDDSQHRRRQCPAIFDDRRRVMQDTGVTQSHR